MLCVPVKSSWGSPLAPRPSAASGHSRSGTHCLATHTLRSETATQGKQTSCDKTATYIKPSLIRSITATSRGSWTKNRDNFCGHIHCCNEVFFFQQFFSWKVYTEMTFLFILTSWDWKQAKITLTEQVKVKVHVQKPRHRSHHNRFAKVSWHKHSFVPKPNSNADKGIATKLTPEGRPIDNCFLTPSQLWRSYQGKLEGRRRNEKKEWL